MNEWMKRRCQKSKWFSHSQSIGFNVPLSVYVMTPTIVTPIIRYSKIVSSPRNCCFPCGLCGWVRHSSQKCAGSWTRISKQNIIIILLLHRHKRKVLPLHRHKRRILRFLRPPIIKIRNSAGIQCTSTVLYRYSTALYLQYLQYNLQIHTPAFTSV